MHRARADSRETSGRKRLTSRAPFRHLPPPSHVNASGRFFQAIAARFDLPCGSSHVSANDAFERSLHPINVTRALTSRTIPLWSTPLRMPPNRGAGRFTTPTTRFGGLTVFFRAIERFLLDRTPLSRTSDAPVALVDQTSGALTARACPPTPKIDSPHNLVKSYRTHDPRRLLPFEGLLRSVCSSLPNTQTTKQTGLASIGFATDTTRTSDAPPTLSRC